MYDLLSSLSGIIQKNTRTCSIPPEWLCTTLTIFADMTQERRFSPPPTSPSPHHDQFMLLHPVIPRNVHRCKLSLQSTSPELSTICITMVRNLTIHIFASGTRLKINRQSLPRPHPYVIYKLPHIFEDPRFFKKDAQPVFTNKVCKLNTKRIKTKQSKLPSSKKIDL